VLKNYFKDKLKEDLYKKHLDNEYKIDIFKLKKVGEEFLSTLYDLLFNNYFLNKEEKEAGFTYKFNNLDYLLNELINLIGYKSKDIEDQFYKYLDSIYDILIFDLKQYLHIELLIFSIFIK